ncbi:MAG TPA: hypothetical protein VFP30_05855 [Candidatus Limnocylindria bacterium]|nr:hypothetical protein [Candidatus Limnocylindria bacterium]
MERPVDAVTSAVINLQVAQRSVNACIREIIDRVSADPFGSSNLPELRMKLQECRRAVDEAVDELAGSMERMSENPG